MRTWLFTWNPNRWGWDDLYNGYEEMICQISQTGRAYATWSCGSNKSILEGDRIFLIRLGLEPRGIVASGFAASSVFEGPHWDVKRAKEGDICRRIYVRFDKILNPSIDPILSIEDLKLISPTFCWSSQSSGIRIPNEIAELIENNWKE